MLRVYLTKPGGVGWNKILFQNSSAVNTWTRFYVPIGGLPAGYQIQIEGYGKITDALSPYADMEIDDIQFIDCASENRSENSLNCTFENGLCGWFDADLGSNSKLDWVCIEIYG